MDVYVPQDLTEVVSDTPYELHAGTALIREY